MKNLKKRYEVRVGSLAPPMHEQLGVPEQAADHVQKDADAIVRLSVRGILSESERDRACKRMLKRMERELPDLLAEHERSAAGDAADAPGRSRK